MSKEILQSGYEQIRNSPLNVKEITEIETRFIMMEDNLPDIYLYNLENAYVTPYGIVMKNWKIISSSIYSMFTKHNYYLTFIKKIVLGKVKKIKSTAIIAHNAFYSNYYHWSAEALPRLFLIKNEASSAILILPADSPKFIIQYTNLLGFKNIRFIEHNELFKVEKLLLPTHTAKGLEHNSIVVKEMTSYLKNLAIKSLNKEITTHKNIFLNRSYAAYRKVINENELTELLYRYGFQNINLEDYTVPEQILLLSQAKNVVAIHGAGLVNIMYQQPKSLVLNLIHEKHYDPAFYNLASSLNIDYILLQCRAANIDARGAAWDSFYVDTNKLKTYLDKYLIQ